MSDSLPLFPLGSVLFPGVVLPLHIFEGRYRELMKTLLESPADMPRRFGVITVRQGREVAAGDDDRADPATALHAVGCAAEVREVDSKSDGTYDIVTVGVRRFRLLGVDTSSAPYLVGDVDWLPTEPEPGPEAGLLAQQAGALFTAYLQAIASTGGAEVAPFELPTDPALLSYLVASAALLTLEDRQDLLESGETTDRLRAEIRLLRREIVLVRELHAVPVPLADLTEEPGLN